MLDVIYSLKIRLFCPDPELETCWVGLAPGDRRNISPATFEAKFKTRFFSVNSKTLELGRNINSANLEAKF